MVDDDSGLITMMKTGLKPFADNFELVTAGDGKEALEALSKEKFSLVVTDLMMPVMDGFQLLAEMMEKYPFTPRMVMSSIQTCESRGLEENSGIEAFLVKPVTPKEAGSRIIQILDNLKDKTGSVKGISLMSFVQLMEMEQKNCILQATHSETGERGFLFFRDGQIIDAKTDRNRGTDAAYRILSWTNVQISIRDGQPQMPDVVRTSMQTLIMEAAYRADVDMMSDEQKKSLEDGLETEKSTDSPSGENSIDLSEFSSYSFTELVDEGFDSFRNKNYPLAKAIWLKAQEMDPSDKNLSYNLKLVEKKLAAL